ncbi:MAG: hypothetical protein WAQ25_04870 [Candidatus Saccharimonas sp.]
MIFIYVLIAYALALFIVAYTSRRAMGVPALALTAGAVLANLWTESLTPLVASAGIVVVRPPLASVVAVIITLLPALMVMPSVRRLLNRQHRIVTSLVFALLAVMLTYGAFANAVVLDEPSKQYMSHFLSYDKTIITTAIIAAVVDVAFYKKPTQKDEHKK